MRMRTLAGVLTTAFLAVATLAFAQDKFGVAVYPGAKPDTATSDAVKKMMNSEAECYRTTDSLDKVMAFYKKQSNLAAKGTTADGGMFQRKDDPKVSLTVQNPWMDMTTGKMVKDTLITIVKQQ